MTKSIEVQGRTEDEAIELALEQLGLSRDDVSVEIVDQARTTFLGLKSNPAIVKVTYESDGADDSLSITSEEVKEEKPKHKSNEAVEIPSGTSERVEAYLNGLFKHMDSDVTVSVTSEYDCLSVVLTGKDPGTLIGRRGETLDAIQHLTNYSINRGSASRVRINLDSENYRQRRNDSLENLATRTAGKVVKYRRNMTLDPMNAFERHIIHSVLQENKQVSTFSVGSDPHRRVVIAYGNSSGASAHTDTPQYKEWS
ncbi:MAG: protein jag [Oscillospiraceae bacterium]|jgi:spoIIIJ-associated protein|nr:protein jag [Oscillospiraceae bacterium]